MDTIKHGTVLAFVIIDEGQGNYAHVAQHPRGIAPNATCSAKYVAVTHLVIPHFSVKIRWPAAQSPGPILPGAHGRKVLGRLA